MEDKFIAQPSQTTLYMDMHNISLFDPQTEKRL